MIPRGTYFERPIGEQPKDEAEHFIRCPACDGWAPATGQADRLTGSSSRILGLQR